MLTSLADFNKASEPFKKNSQWNEIIQLAKKTLENTALTNEDRGHLHAELTTLYFYLGKKEDYEQAQYHAQTAYDIADEFHLYSLKARASYLLSATARAMGNYEEARKKASEAASIYKDHDLNDPGLEGKVYFNWGAAIGDDPRGNDLAQEKELYLTALSSFQKASSPDDTFRTVTRLINNAIKSGDTPFAHEIQKQVTTKMLDPKQRSTGHYYFALAKLYRLKGNNKGARFYAEQAEKIACTLDAQADFKRAQDLLKQLTPAPAPITPAYKSTLARKRSPSLSDIASTTATADKPIHHRRLSFSF